MTRPTTNRRPALAGALLASAALMLTLGPQTATSAPASTPKTPSIPTASTGSYSVSASSVTLKGSVDPHGVETVYAFQYGATTGYGAQTAPVSAGNGTREVSVSQTIAGLPPGVTYHYRLIATNAAGTANGQDETFTTKSTPLKVKLAPTSNPDVFGSSFTVSGVLSGTAATGHEVVLQANPFPYLGEFTNLGAPVSTNAAGAFSFRVARLSRTTQLRVAAVGLTPVYSPVVTERVAVRVGIRVHLTGLQGYVRFSGTVAPAPVGAQVVFQWLKPGGDFASTGIGTAVRRGHAGVARFDSGVVLIRHGRGGAYRAFVKVPSGALVSGYSRPTRFIPSAPAPVRKARRGRAGAVVASTPAPRPPVVGTGGASVSSASVTLKGSVNPRGLATVYAFQFGATTGYGAQTAPVSAGNGTITVSVSQAIAGLPPGVTYHYRLVATNAAGTTNGRDKTFTTKQLPVKLELVASPRVAVFGGMLTVSGVLSGAVAAGHEVVLQASRFPFLGGFKTVGGTVVTNAAGAFSFSVPSILETTRFRVATLEKPPAYSPVVAERVAVRVSLHVRPTGRPGFVRMYGTVQPAEVGAPVGLQLIRPGLRPLGVAGTTTVRATRTTSRFSRIVRIRRGGLYRAVAQVNNGRLVPGHSRAVLLG